MKDLLFNKYAIIVISIFTIFTIIVSILEKINA